MPNIMKPQLFLSALLLATALNFGPGCHETYGLAPANSAMLDVKSTSRGVLIPRMTFEQRNAIQDPEEGLMVYCTNCNTDSTGALSMYQDGLWKMINLGCYDPGAPTAGNHIPSETQIIWNWNSVPIALGYKFNTIDDYNTAVDLGAATSNIETGLTCWTIYTRYVWSYNACGHSSTINLTQSTLNFPFSPAPTEMAHDSTLSTIVWKWSSCFRRNRLQVG